MHLAKKILIVAAALVMLLSIFSPAIAFLYLLIKDTSFALQIVMYAAIEAIVLWLAFSLVAALLAYEKTKLITQIVITFVVSLFVITACNHTTHTSCTNSKYIDCDY